MLNASKIFLTIIAFFICSCSDFFSIPEEPEADFELSCLTWGDTLTMCEGYIETDPITGYMKVYYYEDDLYYGTSFYLCGADLTLNTGNPLSDALAENETEDNLACVDGDDNSLDWAWEEDTIFASWNNLELEIYIPECYYGQSHCAGTGYGYIHIL